MSLLVVTLENHVNLVLITIWLSLGNKIWPSSESQGIQVNVACVGPQVEWSFKESLLSSLMTCQLWGLFVCTLVADRAHQEKWIPAALLPRKKPCFLPCLWQLSVSLYIHSSPPPHHSQLPDLYCCAERTGLSLWKPACGHSVFKRNICRCHSLCPTQLLRTV